MKFSYAFHTDKGPRSENEDAVQVWAANGQLAMAIADGLGGHQGGALASNTAMEIIQSAFLNNPQVQLAAVAMEAHERILEHQRTATPLREMATTFTVAILQGTTFRFVHCGDTRLVLQRGNGIKRLTTDQTEAQRLLDAGKLTPSEFENYPRKNILDSALGVRGKPYLQQGEGELLSGDRMFAMSDGVYGVVPLRELKAISDRHHNVEAFMADATAVILGKGPTDNFSLAAVFCA